ncbi:hypothetical protein Bca4012_092149 [Brassica carinata]
MDSKIMSPGHDQGQEMHGNLDSSKLLGLLLLATKRPVRPPTRYVATCQASKRSSLAFSFESSSKRSWFRLNQNFR